MKERKIELPTETTKPPVFLNTTTKKGQACGLSCAVCTACVPKAARRNRVSVGLENRPLGLSLCGGQTGPVVQVSKLVNHSTWGVATQQVWRASSCLTASLPEQGTRRFYRGGAKL